MSNVSSRLSCLVVAAVFAPIGCSSSDESASNAGTGGTRDASATGTIVRGGANSTTMESLAFGGSHLGLGGAGTSFGENSGLGGITSSTDATSSNGGTASSDGGTASSNGGTASSNGGTASSDGGTTSSSGGTTSSDGGTTSSNGGTTSSNGGTASSSGGTTSSGGASSSGTTPITLWIAGDSTVQTCSSACPCGWGGPSGTYFNSNVTVNNQAISGRSIQTWMYEPNVTSTKGSDGECAVTETNSTRWSTVLNGMKAGDYFLIQFGINDGDTACPRHVGSARYVTLRYVTEATCSGCARQGSLPGFYYSEWHDQV